MYLFVFDYLYYNDSRDREYDSRHLERCEGFLARIQEVGNGCTYQRYEGREDTYPGNSQDSGTISPQTKANAGAKRSDIHTGRVWIPVVWEDD